VTSSLRSRPSTYWLLAVPAGAAVGALVAAEPLATFVAAATIIAAVACRFSSVRLVAIAAGGLLVLQGSEGISLPKLLYFGLILVSWLTAIDRLILRRSSQTWDVPFRRLFLGSTLLIGLVCISAAVALDNGIQLVNWARDATPYAMLAFLPIIGIDCARDVSSRFILVLLSTVGTIAALGFLIDWLGRRGVSDIDLTKFSLSSFALIAAVFSVAIVRAASGPRRWRWLALAAFALVSLLATGARTGIVLLAGLLGISSGRKRVRIPVHASLGVLAVLTLLAVVSTPLVVARVSSDPAFLSQRLEAALSFFQGSSDPSYSDRAREYAETATQVSDHPLLGTGPGFLYPPIDVGDDPTFTLDTPLITPAKFGLLGAGIVILLLVQVASTIPASRRLVGATQVGAALRGFGFIFLADLPFGGFVEDKGFSIALMLFIGLLVSVTRERVAASANVQHAQVESRATPNSPATPVGTSSP
jgi:hypothetical protein